MHQSITITLLLMLVTAPHICGYDLTITNVQNNSDCSVFLDWLPSNAIELLQKRLVQYVTTKSATSFEVPSTGQTTKVVDTSVPFNYHNLLIVVTKDHLYEVCICNTQRYFGEAGNNGVSVSFYVRDLYIRDPGFEDIKTYEILLPAEPAYSNNNLTLMINAQQELSLCIPETTHKTNEYDEHWMMINLFG